MSEKFEIGDEIYFLGTDNLESVRTVTAVGQYTLLYTFRGVEYSAPTADAKKVKKFFEVGQKYDFGTPEGYYYEIVSVRSCGGRMFAWTERAGDGYSQMDTLNQRDFSKMRKI